MYCTELNVGSLSYSRFLKPAGCFYLLDVVNKVNIKWRACLELFPGNNCAAMFFSAAVVGCSNIVAACVVSGFIVSFV